MPTELYYPKAKKNHQGEMKPKGKYKNGHPAGAVVHFTAGRSNPVHTVEWGIEQNYCFFVIGPDGQVYQNFPLDSWGSHAGDSHWKGLDYGDPKVGVSQYLVGIEICCAGRVRKVDENTFRPWWNDPEYYKKRKDGAVPPGIPKAADDLPPDQVRQVPVDSANQQKGWYHKYTAAQEAALMELLQWLKANSPQFSFDLVLGHDEVAPERKNDPGGALSKTMPSLRASLKFQESQSQTGAT